MLSFVTLQQGGRGGPQGPEPTRFGDWQMKGRVSHFGFTGGPSTSISSCLLGLHRSEIYLRIQQRRSKNQNLLKIFTIIRSVHVYLILNAIQVVNPSAAAAAHLQLADCRRAGYWHLERERYGLIDFWCEFAAFVGARKGTDVTRDGKRCGLGVNILEGKVTATTA